MSMIDNSTSLTAVIEAGGRLVEVDTSGADVVMFFRSADGQTEYRVEMFPDRYSDPYSPSYDFNRVEWKVQEFPVVTNA